MEEIPSSAYIISHETEYVNMEFIISFDEFKDKYMLRLLLEAGQINLRGGGKVLECRRTLHI